ncbi:hypothetical protein [Paenibacillus pini]|uniref:Aminoglycoside phosphotransferase domain-containing protein n=1 Tax=Paenibacillus pini JCM 16418 TaxID=1236976 RepID=W7YPY1_9BACL|nr:hypothetical protein [Paenibacillus pini]GAF06591.1 hypothetical protein JCM16418_559 [Paenibacillus pini JCM 16418]
MTNIDVKSGILKKYNIHEADLLGSGMEAEVYIYGKDKVLKIYNRLSNFKKQEILKQFYSSIQSTHVSYQLPYIYNIMDEDGVVVTVEKRIYGENMNNLLPKLSDEQLNAVMKTYLFAHLELQSVKLDPPFKGLKLFDDYIPVTQQSDWNDVLQEYVISKQQEIGGYFSKDVINYQDKLQILLKILSCEYQGVYSLIHGDFFQAMYL